MSTRIVIRRARRAQPIVDTKAIEDLMQSIAKSEDTIAVLSAQVKTDLASLTALMQKAKQTTHFCGELVAEVVVPSGRSSTTIDPRKFYLAVDEGDFFDAVTVSVTKAREILPERALAKISKTEAGKPGEPTVKLKRIKVRG